MCIYIYIYIYIVLYANIAWCIFFTYFGLDVCLFMCNLKLNLPISFILLKCLHLSLPAAKSSGTIVLPVIA